MNAMKHYKTFCFILMTILFSLGLSAQVRPLNDSIMVARIHRISARLVLTPRQEEAILAVARQQVRSLDSVRKVPLTAEQRKAWFASYSAGNERQLKSIFSPDQWQAYDKMMHDKREAFIKHAGERKIKVHPINN
jgi:hypothetical protein